VEGHLARVQLAMPGVLILLMSPRPVPKIRGLGSAISSVFFSSDFPRSRPRPLRGAPPYQGGAPCSRSKDECAGTFGIALRLAINPYGHAEVLCGARTGNKNPRFPGISSLQSPLTDSNRRPPLYEEGPLVKGRLSCVVQSGWVPRWWVSSWAHLSIASSREDKADWSSLRWRISLKDRQAARGSVAPLGAKGCSRVSMCQIASVRRRARSIWATLAPRCLPMRALVRW
jgi:hypothetical protein